MPGLIVRPATRAVARRMCAAHPHARTLPNSSRYYMAAYLDGRPAGLAVWGWGIMPRKTPGHLFGEAGNPADYLELCRFFVYDWCPKNTASQFLAATHRILRKYAPSVKWLYTYAAGFQGLVGTIYQAANYDYIGRTLCDSFVYIPGRGLVHSIALWHRYGVISGANNASLRHIQCFIPAARRWCGYNFRYIYWLCGKAERERLMAAASFVVQTYPTTADLDIWLEDVDGTRSSIPADFAKSVPIVKLSSRARAGSILADAPANQAGEGGAAPTPALHSLLSR